jgi:surface antigen
MGQPVMKHVFRTAIAMLFLAGCEALPEGESATSAPEPVLLPPAEGLGYAAAGGLLGRIPKDGTVAANSATNGEAKRATIEGRILQGGYAVHLSQSDQRRAKRASLVAFETLPSGQTKIWRNPDNGHWGTLTPWRTYLDAVGRYCREYRQTVTLGGLEHRANGTVCRRGDGVWQIQS